MTRSCVVDVAKGASVLFTLGTLSSHIMVGLPSKMILGRCWEALGIYTRNNSSPDEIFKCDPL